MQPIRKQVTEYLYSFKDNDFHELNNFLKSSFPDEHINTIKNEIQALSIKKRIEVEADRHLRWTQYTGNIHPEHNVIADLENWKVAAKINADYRETLDAEEIELQKNKNNEELQELQKQVLRLEREDLILRQQNSDLDTQLRAAQLRLTQMQSKELRWKKMWAIFGTISSALLTLMIEHAKEILRFLQGLLQ